MSFLFNIVFFIFEYYVSSDISLSILKSTHKIKSQPKYLPNRRRKSVKRTFSDD